MLSHDNMTWFWLAYNEHKYEQTYDSMSKVLGANTSAVDPARIIPEELPPSRMVSFLPLSHITAQMSDLTRMLISRRPIQVTFAGPNYVATSLHKVLQIVQPTDFLAVPRVYEKWQQYFLLKLNSTSES